MCPTHSHPTPQVTVLSTAQHIELPICVACGLELGSVARRARPHSSDADDGDDLPPPYASLHADGDAPSAATTHNKATPTPSALTPTRRLSWSSLGGLGGWLWGARSGDGVGEERQEGSVREEAAHSVARAAMLDAERMSPSEQKALLWRVGR